MRRFSHAPFLLLTIFALAGCLSETPDLSGDPDDGLPADVWGPVKALLAGVPCEVASVTDRTSDNLKFLRNVSWEVGTGEVDVRGDIALVARQGSGSAGGIEIVNISDPLVARIVTNYTDMRGGLDVKWSPDGMTALIGNSTGIVMVDVRDPELPTLAGVWTFPPVTSFPGGQPSQNAHMLATAEIGGGQWVFLAPNSNTGTWVLKLEGPPEARTLTLVTQTMPLGGGPLGPHDIFVHPDPFTEKWTLYSADGFHGWNVFDVSDPAKPARIGGLNDPETGYTHSIQAAKVGDRRIVTTSAEVGANILKVYDATDLLLPKLLAVWQAHPGTNSVDPQHNHQIVDGRLYLAHYGNGIYVFDLTRLGPTPLLGSQEMEPVAHWAAEGMAAHGATAFADYWDVVLKDGLVYANDRNSGLHILGYGCLTPGDPLYTSVA